MSSSEGGGFRMARAVRKPKARRVVGGVDTHADTHHAAVMLMNGGRIADAEFAATAIGFEQLLAWLASFGRVHAVGVEGTGSYGKQLTLFLRQRQVRVVEVNRPDRRQRRALGKSDPLDAYAAADAVLAERARVIPKSGDGAAEALRLIHAARAGAVKARTATINQLRAALVTGPVELREQLAGQAGRSTSRLIEACARLRPDATRLAQPIQASRHILRRLARRYQQLSVEISEADRELTALVRAVRPDLLATFGVGPEVAAQLLVTAGDNPDRLGSDAAFAALCGVNPVPASSGKITRHRLNQAGDRQANRALHTIVLTRLAHDPATRAYLERRMNDGRQSKTKKEIIRCLKRYVAREIYKILTSPPALPKDHQIAA